MATFDSVRLHITETTKYESILALLEWDQQTYLPKNGNEYRAEQIATLASLIHGRNTDPKLGEWLDELANQEHADPQMAASVRNAKRDFDRSNKLPVQLVEDLARCTARAHQIWAEARENDDFQSFQPALTEVITLKQQQADAIGYEECRYDALLDEYEPAIKTSDLRPLLEGLRQELVPLLRTITESGKRAPVELIHRHFPVEAQARFGKMVASAIGFDFDRGRLDETHHPFCTEIGPSDCRITTRYNENYFSSAFFGTLHEAGHGMYEQGLPEEWYGMAPGKFVSLGVHESQSRLWENHVGRSLAFWRHFMPAAVEHFPSSLSDVALEDWYWSVNDVRPTLIRVEADEATYNLHIIIRFELEQELIDGSLTVADAPAAWNERYEKYLGIKPSNDSEGILQDVHWSAGLFGYFPTYSLGNLYAAQLFEKADEATGGLTEQFVNGEFGRLLSWLRQNIHSKGQCLTANELVKQATGCELSHDALIRHLTGKLMPLYGAS